MVVLVNGPGLWRWGGLLVLAYIDDSGNARVRKTTACRNSSRTRGALAPIVASEACCFIGVRRA